MGHAEAFSDNSSGRPGVWRYYFDVLDKDTESDGFLHKRVRVPGALHCSENKFLTHRHRPISREERNIENNFTQWWINFAYNNDPNIGHNPRSLTWFRYDVEHPQTLILNNVGVGMDSTVNT